MLIQILAAVAQVLAPSVEQLPKVHREVEYRHVGGWFGTMDIHTPGQASRLRPALVYFHGGGWSGGSRGSAAMHLEPYLARGFVVANVSYRLAATAPAPAAASDARCAFHWLASNASRYGIDAKRIILSGHSAGAHLALMSAFAPTASAGDGCENSQVRPAAVVAWNAPTDLVQYLRRRRDDGDSIPWLENTEDPLRMARQLSPAAHVRRCLPPTISVHAVADPEIPHAEAVRFHSSLSKRGVRQELVTIRSSGHLTKEHPPEEVARAYQRVWQFLAAVLRGSSDSCRPRKL